MYFPSSVLIFHMSFGFAMCASFGPPDCNPLIFLENMERLCHTYYGFALENSNYLKREIGENFFGANLKHVSNFDGFGTESFHRFLQQSLESQNFRVIQPYPWQLPPGNYHHPALPPQYPYPYRLSGDEIRRRDSHQLDSHMEPQDFDTFNYWYLNPVYSDDDLKGGKERWKRNGFKDFYHWLRKGHFPSRVLNELWNFFRDKCCGDGCLYPEEFAKLDERINFCKMH